MSTILKVLKQIELERIPPRNDISRQNGASIGLSSGRGVCFAFRRMLVVFIAVALGLAGLFLAIGPGRSVSEPDRVDRQTLQELEQTPLNGDTIQDDGKPEPKNSSLIATKSELAAAKQSPLPEVDVLEKDHFEPFVPPAMKKEVFPSAGSKNIPQQINTWHGEGVKVQAIVWGPNPQERMAVVNNRVVRTGDIVNGFSIKTINERSLVIEKQQSRWKVYLGK